MVHGLWMTGMETGLLRNRLRDDYGFDTRQYSYHTVQVGLEDNVRLLAQYLADVPGETVHVVGHSLGGLLWRCTRWARHPGQPPGPRRVPGLAAAGQFRRARGWRGCRSARRSSVRRCATRCSTVA